MTDAREVAREIVKACYDAEPLHRMPLTGGACADCITAALERERAEAGIDLMFLGASRLPDGSLSIDMQKYHAAHRCGEHATIKYTVQDLDVCMVCLRAQVERLSGAEQRWEDKYDDLCRTHEAQRQQLAAVTAERDRAKDWIRFHGEHCGLTESADMLRDQREDARIALNHMTAERDAMRRVVEAARPFQSGGMWGALKAWLVEGAPTRAEGVAMAKWLTSQQARLDEALVAALPPSEAPEPRPQHVCGLRGFSETSDRCPACPEPRGEGSR